MNKLYSFIFLITANLSAYSQQIALKKIDEFTKKEVIQVNASKNKNWKNSDNISEGFYNRTFLSLRRNDNTNTLQLDIQTGSLLCINNEDGKIMILFEDTSTITLPQVSRLDCAQRVVISYLLTNDQIKELANKTVQKIRIYTNNGYIDQDIKKEKTAIIKNTFEIFSNT